MKFASACRPKRVAASGGTVGRNYLINGYRQIFPMHTNPIEMIQGPAPYLQMGRIDIPAIVEDEFNDWYNTAYIPPYLKVPGCLGARRYLAIDSQPRYLTLYEFANPTVSESEPWDRARNSNPVERPHPVLAYTAARYRLAGCVSPRFPRVTKKPQ